MAALPALIGRRFSLLALSAALAAMGLVATQPLRLGAGQDATVLRPDRVQTIQVDAGTRPNLSAPADANAFGQPGPTPEHKSTTVASLSEAQQQAGFRLKAPSWLPTAAQGAEKFVVNSAVSYSYTLDLQKIQSYLAANGMSQLVLPPNLNGATLTADLPANVIAHYGPDQTGIILAQGKAGSLTVPPEIDVEAVRLALLNAPNLPPELAAVTRQLQNLPDWQHTLPLPVPTNAQSHTVTLARNGAAATVLVDPASGHAAMIWLENGVFYGLAGAATDTDLIRVAESLR